MRGGKRLRVVIWNGCAYWTEMDERIGRKGAQVKKIGRGELGARHRGRET